MADLKISQLTDGGASQAADEYVVARSGANYRIDGASVAAAATSVGTLSSLTVSGNLAVDTNTLYVDAANNRVGIGTASPGYALHVTGGAAIANRTTSDSAGNVSLGVLSTASSAQFGWRTDTSNNLAFDIYNGASWSQAMTMSLSGNLGLGVTPSAWSVLTPAMQLGTAGSFLTAQGSTAAVYLGTNAYFDGTNFRYVTSGASASYLSQAAGVLSFLNAPSGTAGNTISFTTRMTLDASGNLGVGETSPGAKLEIKESSANTPRFRMYSAYNGGASDWGIDFYRDTDAANDQECAFIRANRTGGNVTGLVFGTGSSGTGATEKARITSGGDLLVGITGATDAGTNAVRAGLFSGQRSASADPVFQAWNQATSGDNVFVQFYTEGGSGTLRGSITYNRGAGQVAYNITSDERLKDNIADAEDAGAMVDAMQVRQFDWKETGNHLDYGFVAQELHAVVPHAVTVPEDEDKFWSVDYSKLVPMLVKEIQSLRARVAALEA